MSIPLDTSRPTVPSEINQTKSRVSSFERDIRLKDSPGAGHITAPATAAAATGGETTFFPIVTPTVISRAYLVTETAIGADFVVTLHKNGTEIGTVTVTAGATRSPATDIDVPFGNFGLDLLNAKVDDDGGGGYGPRWSLLLVTTGISGTMLWGAGCPTLGPFTASGSLQAGIAASVDATSLDSAGLLITYTVTVTDADGETGDLYFQPFVGSEFIVIGLDGTLASSPTSHTYTVEKRDTFDFPVQATNLVPGTGDPQGTVTVTVTCADGGVAWQTGG